MSDFIFKVKGLSHQNIDGQMNNINLALKYKELHSLIIKNNTEQITLIESILANEGKSSGNECLDKDCNLSDIQVLYKDPIIMENLSVGENLFINRLPKRLSFFIDWNMIEDNFNKICKSYGLVYDPKQKAESLSIENKKILYLLKILACKPKIIIIQELTEHLSSDNVLKVNRIIKNYIDEGGSIIYITKQWEEALDISDYITIITNGNVVASMSANEAKRNPRKLINMIEGYKYKSDEDREENNVLNAVFKSAEFLTSEYELKDILMLMAKELTDVMGADACYINLIEPQANIIMDNFVYTKNTIDIPIIKDDLILEIASQNDIFYSNVNEKGFKSMFYSYKNIKTIISIPILIRTQLSGLVSIYYNDIYTQTEEETMYLMTFARHVAIAIEDTRLMGRTALLQESHHRIKNNLQSIISLIAIQKSTIDYTNDKQSIEEVFEKIISSIMSIASVHELLSRNEHGGSIINLKSIIESIVGSGEFNNIDIKFELKDVFISHSKATSIAIVVNELLLNSKKHAFKDLNKNYPRQIIVSSDIIKDEVVLIVKDNGVGISEDFSLKDLSSVGLSVITGIIKSEFQGDISFTKDHGTIVKILLPRKWII